MELLKLDDVLEKADAHYAAAVAGQCGVDIRYAAPETLPRVESRQVKALAAALVDEINLRFAALAGWGQNNG